MSKVGFIGVGYMGYGMVKNLLKKHDVYIFAHKNRKPINKLLKIGAHEIKSYEELKNNDLNCLMLCVTNTPIALKVADKINKNIRVVNIPCWEIFHNQNNEYKERILLTNCKKRISIEAGSTHGWEKFTGIEGLNIGIDDFGHSAPGTDVAKKFGFTLDNIKKQIEDYLK